jgi:phytoene dehydrogenase-like protein
VTAPVVIIGGGVNGLTAAAQLAKSGVRTVVLEARPVVGGAAVTEEFHPGFRASTVAHLSSFDPAVANDLGLAGRGLELVAAEPRVVAPLPDGRQLSLWGDPARTASELAAFSAKDAKAWPEFHATLGRLAAALGRVLRLTPPEIDELRITELLPFVGAGLAIRRLGREDGQNLLRWGPMAVADFVQEWFETPLLQAMVAARGVRGAFAGPWSAGTTANLLLQAAATGGSGADATVYVKGGLGALTSALADVVRARGGLIRTGATVDRLATSGGRVTGVVLAGGETLEARAVASSADLPRTFLRMLDPALLDPDDARRVRNFRIKGMASKVNLAMEALPKGLADLRARIHVGADIDAIERAFDEAKYGAPSTRPLIELTVPTLVDPGLAPAGKHVVSAYVQYTPYRLAKGDWGSRRDEVRKAVLSSLDAIWPDFSSRVIGHQVLTPADLEATYGLTGGHPAHGEPSLDQLFLARPLLGWARYRGPLPGLYLCGAGTHPGGGVTGLNGWNAAREILKDLR